MTSAVAAARLTSIILLGAVMCGCQSTQHPASPTSSTNASAPTTPSAAPVQKSQRTTPDKCPATTCDLAQTTLYTLLPEALTVGLARVDSPKSLTSGFYEMNLTLDTSSATSWASFTAAHLHAHVAVIRDDLVLEAPIIEEQVTSGQVALTTQTAEAADQLAQLAGRRPA